MKLFKIINKLFKKHSNQVVNYKTEEEYYEYLFTKNKKWSSPEPNNDEKLRWEVIKTFIETQLKDKRKDSKIDILDLGCGRGWLTNLLSNYGNVIGIEPVKPVIDYAKKMFPNIEFLTGTSKTILEVKNNSFNFIVSSEVIEHIPNDEKDDFIEDISKLLKKDGFLILTTPRKEAQQEWNKYSGTNQPIEDWISENELKELVTKKYFKVIDIERVSMEPKFDVPAIPIYQLWIFQKIN